MSTQTASHSRIALAGLIAGLALNAIDTPWSVLVMVPRMTAFTDAHGLQASALAGPWFLATHFAYALLIAWVYSLATARYRAGPRLALLVAAAVLVVNRGFGMGNVLIGIMPAPVFAGFSVSFIIGSLVAGLIAGRILDRAR